MRAPLAALLAAAVWACGGSRDSEPAESAAPPVAADSLAEERVVVLETGPLHLEPDERSPGVTTVSAGSVLRVVPSSAGIEGWVEAAVWDDRRGWIPASRVVPAALWSHYGAALGGVSPSLLRPAYPVADGRWGVEAPVGSAGITPASSVWLVGDSTAAVRVAAIDSIENLCGGELRRFGILDAAGPRESWPQLDAGRIAVPSGDRPTARPVAVGALDPDPALVRLVEEAAAALAAGAGPAAATAWAALGPNAAWATLSWPDADEARGISQRAVALVLRRTAGGWERASSIAPTGSTAAIPTAAWQPIAAYTTGGAEHPTILLLETREYEGAHLDVWIERGGGFQRLYEGYYWGC